MDKKNFALKNVVGYAIFALVIIAIIIVRFTVGSIINVSGLSMYPTFNDNDLVFATVVHDNTELDVGDIVIVKEGGNLIIKRIAGTPGTTVEADTVKKIPEVTLGENEYYVLGDNWEVSRDSRIFGPVDRSMIVFKYAGIHWNRFTLIISFLAPIIILIAQMTIVFIPNDKKEDEEVKSGEESASDETDTDASNVVQPIAQSEFSDNIPGHSEISDETSTEQTQTETITQ